MPSEAFKAAVERVIEDAAIYALSGMKPALTKLLNSKAALLAMGPGEDDITPEAVDVMRKRAAPIIDAEEWETTTPPGFTPHDGKSMPYGPDELVDVIFRNGSISSGSIADALAWDHSGDESDIIAHRRSK